MRSTRLAAVLGLFALAGCSKDSTGPSVSFPALPQPLLDNYCVRGQAVVGQTVSGFISSGDCDDGAYYEIWRVRTGTAGTYTFDANSAFDNYLIVLRLESYTTTSATLTILGENDDRSPGNLNALVAVSMQPGIDYFVAISGFDYTETGSYTLQIR